MARVEWTRLEGNDVEALVAMFVNREHVDSVRITPSKGDGGVDILDRAAGPGRSDVVHQVKSYTEPLSSRQRAAVEESLMTLMEDPRWSELNVKVWYLVTPWDPTPEAEGWLHSIAKSHDLRAVWRGLTYADQLAAKYPDVVDYYIHGGRSRIDEAYQRVAALIGIGLNDESLDVPSAVRRIEGAVKALDSDPHYRYELRLGEGPLPAEPSRPGLVMSWITGKDNGGPWTIVDIIARCAASTEVRPITVTGTVTAESGSDFEHALRDFVRFGTPFTSPEGAYRGEIDAPGGLGGRLEGATVTAKPTTGDIGENSQLHLEILATDQTVLSAVDVDRIERSLGRDGFRTVLDELHHVFTIEDRFDLTEQVQSRTVNLGTFIGEPVGAVRAGLTFLSHCEPPNMGRVSVRHTPPERGLIDTSLVFSWSDQMKRTLHRLLEGVDALCVIQEHTPTRVLTPDFDALPAGQLESWLRARRLLRGEDVITTYPDGHCLIVELDIATALPRESFAVAVPFGVEIGNQTIDLGRVDAWLESPTLVESRSMDGRTYYAVTTPDRKIRYSYAEGDTREGD